MVDGFRVDLGALENAASGVNDTLKDPKDARVDSLSGNVPIMVMINWWPPSKLSANAGRAALST
jgi:hypothetical protein